MSRITVEQGSMTTFLDELPKLLLQYQQMQIDDKRRQEQNQVKVIEHLINVSDRRNQTLNKEIDTYKQSYEKTSGAIFNISDENASGNALDVLNKMTGNVIEDLSTLANAYQEDNQRLRSIRNNIKEDIGQMGLIKDFYTGLGHDYKGGIDPEAWDKGDFTDKDFKEYMSKFPELENVEAEPFFDAIKRKSEAGLDIQIQALNKILDEETIRGYKKDIYSEKSKDTTSTDKSKVRIARDYFGQRVNNVEIDSGILTVDTKYANAIDVNNEFGGIADPENNPLYKDYLDTRLLIGEKIAYVLGTSNTPSTYDDFNIMIAKAQGGRVNGKYVPGDYTSYYDYVKKAYANWKRSNKDEQIEKYAQDILGFSGGFEAFYKNVTEQYTNQILVSFEDNGQINEGTAEKTVEEEEWDNILGDY